MSCEYIIVVNRDSSLRLWVDLEQDFNETIFFDALAEHANVKLLGRKVVYTCVGPAQIIEEVSTDAGQGPDRSATESISRDGDEGCP
jgi:hypothetical protein